jgi:pimeloyl-ACP methyl ester carboxylesterase
MRIASIAVAVIVSAIVAGGQSAASWASGDVAPGAHAMGADTDSAVMPVLSVTALPVSPIVWSSCGADEQCGYLKVPRDYARPHGATIEMAVERHLALDPSRRIGSLIIDPGGPGGSGLDDMTNEVDSLTAGVLDDFDVVLFDPRGVQRSDPFTCGESSGSSAPSGPGPDPVPAGAAAIAQLVAGMRQYAAECEKASGAILPYLGTVNVARDLERLRIALGDSKLSYMGQSYGTLIGEVYAQMFATHIRAMVLDSTIDPALSTNQMTLDQAEGFETSLNSFFAWTTSSASPWHPAGNPTEAVQRLIEAAYTMKPPAGRSYAGAGYVYDALLDALYSTALWPTLATALADDQVGDDAPIITMSTHYTTSNSTNAGDLFNAVNCLDHPVSRNLASYRHLAAVDGAAAPIFGPLFAWGEVQCALWPALATRTPAAITAPGSPPVVVVGSTEDSATPYAWAVAVAHQLVHGDLVTFKGADHVAYFYSECVRDVVQTYLVERMSPRPGTVCTY